MRIRKNYIGGNMIAKARPRVTIEAVIIRADGTREDLGVIADSKKSGILQKLIRKVKNNG